jgi:hypothetical protein
MKAKKRIVVLNVDSRQFEELAELFRSGVTDTFSELDHLDGADFIMVARDAIRKSAKRDRRAERYLDLYDQLIANKALPFFALPYGKNPDRGMGQNHFRSQRATGVCKAGQPAGASRSRRSGRRKPQKN